MNPGSTSRERQADTQAPQWMQAIDCVTSIIASADTTYSRSGGGPSGSSHGTTRWTFFQWTASMSTIKSLSTGMLPIGSTTTAPLFLDAASLAASPIFVLQARRDLPLIFTPQEPQMPIEASSRSLAWRMPSSTERSGGKSTPKSSQYAASPLSGLKRLILRV